VRLGKTRPATLKGRSLPLYPTVKNVLPACYGSDTKRKSSRQFINYNQGTKSLAVYASTTDMAHRGGVGGAKTL
jgi:hypothetical protein